MRYLTALLARSKESSSLRAINALQSKRRRRRLFVEQLEDRRLLATFTVINTADSGAGSLRQAIVDANVNLGNDTIQFGSGVSGTITLIIGELAISDPVEIHGPGSGVVTVSGNNASRVFFVSANTSISGLAITGGSASTGGGIYNSSGILNVESCLLSGNSASQVGGGILNRGTLTVDSSTFSGNTALFGGGISNELDAAALVQNSTLSDNTGSYYGGGIYNRSALTINSSTFNGNSGNNGGGIANASEGTLILQNSTLSGNSAGPFGGGIYNVGTLIANNSTISGNSDGGYGGGIYSRGTSTLNNSIVAANLPSNGTNYDVDGVITSGSSHNLIGVDTNLSGISNGLNGNKVGTATAPINPMLGALQDNGGPTATMALLPGSLAFSTGDNSLIPVGVTSDQRGNGYNRIQNGSVDIGALEFLVDTDPFTFIVTNLGDNGLGSLRQSILDANANPGADIIQFASGLTGTILLTSGELAIINDAVDIQGPGASIITVSGNHTSRVFRVTANANISGLTITGGSSDNGGAIYNAYGTLTVRNSTLSGNTADNGGGIYNAHGALTVDTSNFSGNLAVSLGGGIFNANYGTFTVVQNSNLSGNSGNSGGGIYNSSGKLIVDSSVLSGNSASSGGGGIGNSYGILAVASSVIINNSAGGLPGSNGGGGGIGNTGTLTLDDSTVSGNSGSYFAGGIANAGTATVRNSTLSGNSAVNYGGGIFNPGTLTVDSSIFSGNTAAYGGAILNNPDSTVTVQHSTLSGNSASNSGGGIYNRGLLTLDSSTLSGNSANVYGGGIDNRSGTLTVQNDTLSANSAAYGGGIHNWEDGTLKVDSSTVSGNNGGGLGYGGGIYSRGLSTLNNTIVAANLHSSGTSYDIDGVITTGSSHNLIGVDTNLIGISNGTNGNKVGTAASPVNPMLGALQNNGGPTATMALLPGSPAFNAGDNSLIPIGVTTDQRGTAFARIQNGTVDIGALEFLVDTDPVTFIVTNLADNGSGSLRQAVLNANANPGADIIQFAPALTGTISLTSGELAITTDSLDIQGPGSGVITISGNNASRIFYVTANATISGLTIRGGSSLNGGGIYNAYGTLNVQNSTLSGNSAASSGGGIYNAYGTLTVVDSILSGNSATIYGGGIYTFSYSTFNVVRNSTFSGNSANYGGGLSSYGRLTVDRSTFSSNTALRAGGGIANGGVLTVQNSILSSNSVLGYQYGGGGISNGGTLTVEGSIISGNSAPDVGGGIANGGVATVRDSTFSSNSAVYNGGGIQNQGTLTIDSSIFSGNTALFGGGVSNEPSASGIVQNSTFSDNSGGYFGGGLYNRSVLTISNSTLNGNSGNNGGGIANSYDGTLLLKNSTLTRNSAGPFGGGIYNVGLLTSSNSTISGNTVSWGSASGGGVYSRGTSTLNNTIVATNVHSSGTAYDIDGELTSGSSHNLIGVDTNLSGISNGINGNKVGSASTPINPMLGALQNNGGPTATIALLPGSPAFNAGDNSFIPVGVTTDQRGIGFARIQNGTVDIGAFELIVNRPPTAVVGGPYSVVEGGSVSLDGLSSSDPDQPANTLTYLWDLDGDGVFGESGVNAGRGNEVGVSPTFSAVGLDGPSTFNVSLKVTDSYGLFNIANSIIVITNAAPTVSLVGPSSANEGQTKHYTFTTTDPGIDVFSVVATSGGSVGTVSNVVFNNLTGAGSFDVTFSDGPVTSNVRIQLKDSDGANSNVATLGVFVSNVAPAVTALTSNSADLAHRSFTGIVTINGAFFDPAQSFDTHTVQVNWGDGTAVETLPAASVNQALDSFQRTHHYDTGGIFTIVVKVIDEDGGVSAQSTTTAVVTGVGLVNGTLYIIGTDGSDHVNMQYKQSQNQLKVDVKLNQGGSNGGGDRIQNTYQASAVSRIVAWLLDGDDHYNGGSGGGADGSVDIPMSQFVFGGAGNDQIQGGTGNDVLIGGSGDDDIQGGSGRDILIGSLGKDTLHGNAGDDILIGGVAANENYLAALDQAIADWSSGNLAATLFDLGLITDDNNKDELFGEQGNDYLYGGIDDKLKQ